MRLRTIAVAASVGCLALVAPLSAHAAVTRSSAPPTPAVPPPSYASVVSEYLMIPMDDGVKLGATVNFPSEDGTTPAPGRFPVVFSMTPYGRDGVCGCTDQAFYPEHGIVSAVVDVRGTGGSEGNLDQNYFSPREARDGYELVEWLAHQPWSTGRVAMDGGSYLGITQLMTAELDPPGLVAIAPEVALADIYRDAYAPGGIPSLSFDTQYLAVQGGPGLASGDIGEPGDSGAGPDLSPATLPGQAGDTATAKVDQAQGRPIAFDYLQRPNDDAWYHARSPWYGVGAIKVPVLIMDGWRDGAFVRGDLEMFEALEARRGVETRVDIFGCTHKGCGAPFDPAQSTTDVDNLQAEEYNFLTHHLLGTPEDLGPPVRYFLQSDGGGGVGYQTAASWPVPGLHWTKLWLGPSANGVTGQPLTDALSFGTMAPGAAAAVPRSQASYATNPAAGLSMSFDSYGTIAASPYVPTDQRLSDTDGLTWQSARAPAGGQALVGPIQLHLVASSTAPDTDWVVRLSDVAPDGSESVITEGGLRASHRALDTKRSSIGAPYHTDDAPQPLVPGRIYDFDIAIIPTAYHVAPGHRLQVRVTTDDMPTRLPATVDASPSAPTAAKVTPLLPAVNTVYMGGADGSWLLVPVKAP